MEYAAQGAPCKRAGSWAVRRKVRARVARSHCRGARCARYAAMLPSRGFAATSSRAGGQILGVRQQEQEQGQGHCTPPPCSENRLRGELFLGPRARSAKSTLRPYYVSRVGS